MLAIQGYASCTGRSISRRSSARSARSVLSFHIRHAKIMGLFRLRLANRSSQMSSFELPHLYQYLVCKAPVAKRYGTSLTLMRMPRMQGLPLHCCELMVMHVIHLDTRSSNFRPLNQVSFCLPNVLLAMVLNSLTKICSLVCNNCSSTPYLARNSFRSCFKTVLP